MMLGLGIMTKVNLAVFDPDGGSCQSRESLTRHIVWRRNLMTSCLHWIWAESANQN